MNQALWSLTYTTVPYATSYSDVNIVSWSNRKIVQKPIKLYEQLIQHK